MAEKLYDLEPLNTLVDGNEKSRKFLIELFNECTPPILNDIKTSYSNKDWKELYAHCHKIKPTVESMGIHTMKPVINDVMLEAKKNSDSEKLHTLIQHFCNTIEETIRQLQTNEL